MGFFSDAVWADLGFPGHLNYDVNRSASGNPFARLPDFKATIKGKLKINARAQLDYQEAIVQSGVFYEVAKWGDTRSYTALDVMGSARYWNQDVDLSLNVQGTLTADVQADFKRVGLDLTRKVKGSRAIAVAHASDLEWVDPVVGARMRHQFASGMGLVLIWVVGRAVFAPGRITFHRIMGAILLYLAIGLTFAALYAFVGVLSTDAFSGMAVKDSPTLSSTMIYFSFGTLTTAGSGDIAALNPFARSLTNVEAMIGQLYPATLLARLVTLEIEGETKRG